MATMNPANAGGPVGGGMMMMNNGSPAVSASMGSTDGLRTILNTWVFDYLLKHGHYDIARSVARDDKFEMRTEQKSSPGRRKDGDMNGDAGDSMDMNIKDDVPDDLPRPQAWDGNQNSGFLLEWFSIFYDLLQAHKLQGGSNKLNGAMNMNPAATYLLHEKQMQRMRESAQNQNINRPGMNPAMIRQMQNGAMNGNMNKPMTQQQMQQLQQSRKAQQMAMQQMQRGDQPDGEMNGARPGTPAEGDNGGSPSKRPRLDNGQQQFNNGMMQNGRPGGVPGAANQGMMIQAGFQPGMNPQFRGNAAMPPKGMPGGMANGMMNMGNAGSPMMQGMNQFPPDNMTMDMSYQRNMQGGQPGMQGGGGGQSGNHALQDYQMQLMLLEQQNKKRLMMARQEQHENNPGNGGPMPGVGMQGTGMSPNGSRTGTSPNPGEMKRTPGMGGLPGSPSAAEAMAGRSPVGMGFMGNMQNPDYNGAMFMGGKDQPMMGAGPGMRPPTSAEINSMRQQGARGNNQFPGGAPMVQQASQGGQQGMGTPGQRNEMPPPQAPAGANGAQRNAGASPNTNNAPPTPSQANKPNPKAKKGATKDDNKRQRPTKKNSTANTNANDDNPPVTPTPSTPITANNPGAMNAANKGQPGMQQNNQHQQQNQGMQMGQQMDQPDLGQSNGFGDFGNSQDPQFNLDFSTLENADVLENFDFDSFLNTSAGDTFDFNADIGVGGDFGMNQPE